MNDITRRHFFGRSATGIGVAALGSILGATERVGGMAGLPHFAPKAKRVIYAGIHPWRPAADCDVGDAA